MASSSPTQATAGTVATFAAGLFSGVALGMSTIDHPVLMELDASGELATKRFPAMYKRAAPLQTGLALTGAAAAAAAAAQGGHCSRVLWGSSGALLAALVPWTLLVMMPTNKKLLAGAEGEDKAALCKKWGRLHLVRTGASITAFGVMAMALARLKHK